jgi:hypothetical protein
MGFLVGQALSPFQTDKLGGKLCTADATAD